MSVSSVSGGAYAYLQSLLQQQQSGDDASTVDPITALLNAFYPSGVGTSATTDPTASPSTSSDASVAGCGGAQFAPDTFGAMIDWQSQQSWFTQKVDQVFNAFDTNGDGSIDKSEFENAFGSNADMSKVDALFNTLDADGNGSISQSELTSAAQLSRAMHHHHHHQMEGSGSGDGAGGPLAQLMSAIDGASSSTTNNADGSSTTTITYADGSTVTLNTPALSSQSSGDGSGSGSGSQDPTFNFLEQLIQLQAKWIADSTNNQQQTIPPVGSTA